MILCPARLNAIFSARPWGAKTLEPFFPEKSNLSEPIGEAWMTGEECRFATGPFADQKLGDAWHAMPTEWTGVHANRDERFPLLVKFIFAEQKLSVQVHPDDEYASRNEAAAGGRGKTEMWYVVDAKTGAEVFVGLRSEVTADSFRRALAQGSAEQCLERIGLRAGDAVFVPARTAHTICGGLVLCEIQQHSDLTYRVYDYDRRDAQGRARELHIEKAMQVLRFGAQRGGKLDPVQITRRGDKETYFVSCPYFSVEKWGFSEMIQRSCAETFHLLIFLSGRGEMRWGGNRVKFTPGEVWMLPAALGEYRLEPSAPAALLHAYVPPDSSEFSRRMKELGIPERDWSRLVHL